VESVPQADVYWSTPSLGAAVAYSRLTLLSAAFRCATRRNSQVDSFAAPAILTATLRLWRVDLRSEEGRAYRSDLLVGGERQMAPRMVSMVEIYVVTEEPSAQPLMAKPAVHQGLAA
jgi:hypothetical protein